MKKKEEPTARRECGQRENVFPGRWEPARRAHRASEGGFPRLSRARHFHGAPSWSSEPGAEFSDTVHELTLGALHFQGGFGVGLELCELFEFGQRHVSRPCAAAVGSLLVASTVCRFDPRAGHSFLLLIPAIASHLVAVVSWQGQCWRWRCLSSICFRFNISIPRA